MVKRPERLRYLNTDPKLRRGGKNLVGIPHHRPLPHIRWLFVIARNSSFTYKALAVDVKSGLHRTRRWREMDSNFRFRAAGLR